MLEFYGKNIQFELENDNKDYQALQKFQSERRSKMRL